MFNDYDENGWRIDKNGNRQHKTADTNLVCNLRFAFKELCAPHSDATLINCYSDFAFDDSFGNNDENFPEFLAYWLEA